MNRTASSPGPGVLPFVPAEGDTISNVFSAKRVTLRIANVSWNHRDQLFDAGADHPWPFTNDPEYNGKSLDELYGSNWTRHDDDRTLPEN
jgi:hypothetical protein